MTITELKEGPVQTGNQHRVAEAQEHQNGLTPTTSVSDVH